MIKYNLSTCAECGQLNLGDCRQCQPKCTSDKIKDGCCLKCGQTKAADRWHHIYCQSCDKELFV